VKRRNLIANLSAAAVAWPLSTRAQQKTMPVIGYLTYFDTRQDSPPLTAFRTGLGELGYVEGQNFMIEYRGAGGHVHLLSELAADLVARQVDVVVTAGGQAPARAAKNETSSIPIVFITGSDPVKDSLVTSLARPAGNLTGITFISTELNPKRLDLLSELVPRAQLIGLLVSGITWSTADMQQAARSKKIQLLVVEARTISEIDAAFATLSRTHADALVVADSVLFNLRREQVIALASSHSLPAIYHWSEFVVAGGLISYGASFPAVFREAGIYAGEILKGAKPADLPVQQPTKFELVINLKTAKELGLSVPQSLLARADEVIE
jgi:putative tryptophan/tyrosine transport system substrate-binding protein